MADTLIRGTVIMAQEVLRDGWIPVAGERIQDVPALRWSPYHGRPMRARVAAMVLRGGLTGDGAQVLAQPGQGRFIRREAH